MQKLIPQASCLLIAVLITTPVVHIKKMLKVSCSFLLNEYHDVLTKKRFDMSNLLNSYTKILSLLHEIEPNNYFIPRKRLPRLNDKELIALNLAAEAVGIDSERYLFKQLPEPVIGRIERSIYNRRKRDLAFKIHDFQQKIANEIVPKDSYHIVDSMPLEVCKMSRSFRSNICCDNTDVQPDYGYCAAQKMHYYGYKFHSVCTAGGVFKAFDITKASTHDIHYLENVKSQFSDCVLIGDKGYLSQQYQYDLFNDNRVNLVTPSRKNQINSKPIHPVLRRVRKRIETLFSQLCDQFMIRRNYAKSFNGFATRILSKVTALTIIQWVNFRQGNNINNIKIAL